MAYLREDWVAAPGQRAAGSERPTHGTMMIVCVFLLLLFFWGGLGDNPTSIVKPYDGPDPGYILAESDGGLSNRLRVMAAYMYIGESKFGGAHLVFVWDVNTACPGHFLEVFQPISTVVFATNASRYVLDKHAKIVYENSMAVIPWIFTMNNIPKNRFGQSSWGQIERDMYSRYWPSVRVMGVVTDFVRKHNICEASAMHLRLTDMTTHLTKKKKVVNINSYFDFVESRRAGEPVYLLTDNPESQRLFLDKYGETKILAYQRIAPASHQKSLLEAAGVGPSVKYTGGVSSLGKMDIAPSALSNGTLLPGDHRFTTLEHALIDILIAAHAKSFKAAAFSSLSDLVSTFRDIGKRDRGWCS